MGDPSSTGKSIPSGKLVLVLVCFFLSGAAGLVYQVAWGKALGLVFGNTVYAIATVLAVFMGGLAAGSAVLGRWSERHANPVELYGWIELGVAAAGVVSLAGLEGVRAMYVASHAYVGGWLPALLAQRFAGAAVVLFVPTFLMGATLPILVRGLTRHSAELGARISRLYWVNTAGAVAGTLGAGFWLLPELGQRATVLLAAALNVIAGVVALGAAKAWQVRGDLQFRIQDSTKANDRSQITDYKAADFRAAIEDANVELRSEVSDLNAADLKSEATGVKFESPDERAKDKHRGHRGTEYTESGEAGESGVSTESSSSGDRGGLPQQWLLAGFAVVGATAFAYEVSWVRLLATHLGSSTYAFTVMLAVFLTGIVLGSAAFELWVKWRPVTVGTFATTQTLTAVAALAFLYFYQQFPELLPMVLKARGATFAGLLQAQFLVSAAAMLPAALVFGFNFPVVTLLIAGRPESSGRYAAAVGRAYAANTVGAIVGAVAAGFWLVPAVGSYRLVALTAIANLVLGAALALKHSRRATLALATQGVVLGGCILAATGAFYDRALATFSTLIYWDYHDQRLTLAEMAATTDVVFAKDGLNATISVGRAEDYVAVRTNGKVDASTRDNITQLLVGHIGPVFHPAPKRVLVIGFGSGSTVSAVGQHAEVERIVCVEIEPAVIEAAPYLERLNRGVLRDPRLEVVLDDARNYLLTTREKFDVIISEPSNPWIAGVAALFTDEYYREAKARLEPGGMFVQWVQAYSLYPEDFRMILATMGPHFPQVSLWRAASSDYLLVGQLEQKPLEMARLRTLWQRPEMRVDLEELGLRRPEGILGYHRLDDADVRRLYAGAARNTDDRTQLEYNAPRALLGVSVDDENREMVREHRSQVVAQAVRVEDPYAALLGAAETMANTEEMADAQIFLAALASAPPSVELQLLRGRVALEERRYAEAREAFRAALARDPGSLEAVHGLGELARRQIDFDSAGLLFRQILARNPDHKPTIESMRTLERARGRWQEALPWQRRLAEMNPGHAELAELGELLMQAGEFAEAERRFLGALEQEPYTYSARRYLGEIYCRLEKWPAALLHLEHAVRLEPEREAGAYRLLAQAYRALGRERDARKVLAKGRRLFPSSPELQEIDSAGS
jgi:spermidine synthase